MKQPRKRALCLSVITLSIIATLGFSLPKLSVSGIPHGNENVRSSMHDGIHTKEISLSKQNEIHVPESEKPEAIDVLYPDNEAIAKLSEPIPSPDEQQTQLPEETSANDSPQIDESTASNQYSMSDVLGIVVLGGRVYTQCDVKSCDREAALDYADTFLGTALGNIEGSCFSQGMTYEELLSDNRFNADFSSNVTGEVYSLYGYDSTERICIPEIYKGCGFIVFYKV